MSDAQIPKPTRRQHITREEEADRCLNHTIYSQGSQFYAVAVFLIIVFAVPIAQHFVEIRQNLAKRAEWKPSSGQPEPGIAPQIYDVFDLLPTTDQIKKANGFWGYWDLIPSVEKINAFESSLKENSVLTTSLLSPTQLVMTQLGAGNEKAYVGRDGWLFYRPDVEYLTTPGFLRPAQLKLRSHGSTAIQPDPIKAILDFSRQLQERDIQLVVMPMCTKPMIQPEMLVGPSAAGADLQNESFPAFVQALESKGVQVFDPTPVLRDLATHDGAKQYLETDTHWTPTAMHQVAMKLGESVRSRLPAGGNSQVLKSAEISNLGDIAEMLKLPADQTLFPKQKVTIQRVVGRDGTPWRADRSSPVLLLGDSFSNIYSLDGMGWGDSAGFAEHLSYALNRPIDKIVINAGGAFASRQELARQLAHGVDRLANKSIVVYEFSMRDLAQGDWKMIKLPPAPLRAEVAPPIVKSPVIQTETKSASAFKSISVSPSSIDLSKHEKFTFAAPVPPGNSVMCVIDPKGEILRKLTGIGTLVDTTIKGTWDGTNVYGRPVPVGEYTFRLEGTRPDHTAIDPVTFPVAVTDGKVKSPKVPPPTEPGKTTLPANPGKQTVPSSVKPKGTEQASTPVKPTEEGLIVTGRIAARAVTPKPGSVPYKDCVIALQLTDLKVNGGTVKGPNIVVYVWGMKDNKLVDAGYSVGQTIQLKLTPWAKVDSKYGGYNRQELDNDDAISWEAYWGEMK